MRHFVVALSSLVLIASCQSLTESRRENLSADSLKTHIQKLSSDEFEGRAPGTLGEEKTVQYPTRTITSLPTRSTPTGIWEARSRTWSCSARCGSGWPRAPSGPGGVERASFERNARRNDPPAGDREHSKSLW